MTQSMRSLTILPAKQPRTELIARAKVNLALHTVGRLADGRHLLDSIVSFTKFGDSVEIESDCGRILDVTGPMASSVPQGSSNLAMRAAALIDSPDGYRISLVKRIPVAAGLGGGSADAAAVLSSLSSLRECPLPGSDEIMGLGSDIPVCLLGKNARVQGEGDQVIPLERLPSFPVALVNPGIPLSTKEVFAALSNPVNSPLESLPRDGSRDSWLSWLATQRNDLESVARSLLPAVGCVLSRIRDCAGCRLARMSGSGATCFGIFDTNEQARGAVDEVRARSPGWWAVATET